MAMPARAPLPRMRTGRVAASRSLVRVAGGGLAVGGGDGFTAAIGAGLIDHVNTDL